jgi:hypothetical protein
VDLPLYFIFTEAIRFQRVFKVYLAAFTYIDDHNCRVALGMVGKSNY